MSKASSRGMETLDLSPGPIYYPNLAFFGDGPHGTGVEFSIRGSERDDDGGWRRSCASRAEIDDLAAVEAEYQWRLGFRRVVPGPAAEAAAALRGDRPASKADELLGDFDRMWPKEADPGAWDRIDEDR